MTLEVIRRLLIGKQMLATLGKNLTPQSDALAVAQAVLLSHDAADLIIAAIAEHVGVGAQKRASPDGLCCPH